MTKNNNAITNIQIYLKVNTNNPGAIRGIFTARTTGASSKAQQRLIMDNLEQKENESSR